MLPHYVVDSTAVSMAVEQQQQHWLLLDECEQRDVDNLFVMAARLSALKLSCLLTG